MNNDANFHEKQHSQSEDDEPKIKLPDPDLENITVLTQNLPNKPILPWNRYDSDWDENVNQENQETEDNPDNVIPLKSEPDQEQIE